MEYIAAQADLAANVVREYIAMAFTDNIRARAALSATPTRDHFMELLGSYDKLETYAPREQHRRDHSNSSRPRKCYNCGKEGHFSKA